MAGENEVMEEFTPETVAEWKRQVEERREELFRRKKWKNDRLFPDLRSRQQDQNFRFVLEWCEEFGDVVGRERERDRLDRLIEKGMDVNAPENSP